MGQDKNSGGPQETEKFSGTVRDREGYFEWHRDDDKRLMTYRYHGAMSEDFIVKELPKIWKLSPVTLAYDSLSDIRGAEASLYWHIVVKLAEEWRAIAKGRDQGTRTALIVNALDYEGLLKGIRAYFDQQTFEVFKDETSGLQWLQKCDSQTQ